MGYAPNNATMVVVGDATSEEIFQLCEKYIEPIPQHAPPPPVTTVEPEQMGERRLVVHKQAELPLLMIAYHVPQTNNPDFYAMNILRTVLVQGESSRMYKRLVDQDQIALEVNLTQQPAFDPTLAIFAAQPKQGVDPAKCEAAIFDELEKIKNAPISDQELEKAKNIRLVEFYHQMRTINGRANTIGTYEVFFGDYNKVFAAAKNYAAVSKEDVQRVAQKYFSANNRTVGTLVPDNARDRGAK
jgi:zinc protease